MARKNSALVAKRAKIKTQTVEFARNAQAQAEYQRNHARYADTSSMVAAWLQANKVTVLTASKHKPTRKRGNAILGNATPGRAALAYGYRHVYSR